MLLPSMSFLSLLILGGYFDHPFLFLQQKRNRIRFEMHCLQFLIQNTVETQRIQNGIVELESEPLGDGYAEEYPSEDLSITPPDYMPELSADMKWHW